jgi:quercetin dioxygenase-like cupin family protein
MRRKHLIVLAFAAGAVAVQVFVAATNAESRPVHSAATDTVVVTRPDLRPSQRGPETNFTGVVRVDPLFDPTSSSTISAASVTFEPGARTAWHLHPKGQRLIVTGGVGRVQVGTGTIHEIRPGDVVWIPAGTRHWHGASPNVAMTHIAVQELVNGSPVTWLEKVSEDQYRGRR